MQMQQMRYEQMGASNAEHTGCEQIGGKHMRCEYGTRERSVHPFRGAVNEGAKLKAAVF